MVKSKKNKAVRIKSTRERRYSALKCSWEASHGVSIPGWLTAPIRAPRCNRDTHSVHTSLQRGCRFSNSAPILGFDSQQIVLTIIYMPSAIYKAECFKKNIKYHLIKKHETVMDFLENVITKNANLNTRAVSLGHNELSLKLTTYYYQFKFIFYIRKYICKLCSCTQFLINFKLRPLCSIFAAHQGPPKPTL